MEDVVRRIAVLEAQIERSQVREGMATAVAYPLPPYLLMPTSSTGVSHAAPISASRVLHLLRWTNKIYVNTTNNSTNYWTVTLRIQTRNTTTNTTIATFNTSTYAANTGYMLERTEAAAEFSTNPVSGASYWGIFVELAKTGTPGTIFLDTQLDLY